MHRAMKRKGNVFKQALLKCENSLTNMLYFKNILDLWTRKSVTLDILWFVRCTFNAFWEKFK